MIQNIKCVDIAFIDDNEYLTDNVLQIYNIDKVYHAIDNPNVWSYYFHIPINNNKMEFIEYSNKEISSTNIINKIRSNIVTDYNDRYNDRYTRENILKVRNYMVKVGKLLQQ